MSSLLVPATRPLALIVDDDATMRLLLVRTLRNEGFECRQAVNGREGVDAFMERTPDIVLLDVLMPELDGYGACDLMRQAPGGQHTPIVMLTGLEDTESIDRAFQQGATDFISKPIQWGVFRHRIRYIMRASRAFADLTRNQASLADAQRLAKLGSWEGDPRSHTLRCSEEMRRIMGFESCEATLDQIVTRFQDEDQLRVRSALDRVLSGANFEGEGARVVLQDGSVRYVRLQALATRDAQGAVTHVSGTVQDVTEIKEAEERIRFLAHHDGVTELPNRTAFIERTQHMVTHCRRNATLFAVLTLGIDHFKRVNDTLGQTVGNDLLRAIAQRLSEVIRPADVIMLSDDMSRSLARFGGDEFSALIANLAQFHDAARIANRLLSAIRAPFHVNGQELFLSASIGLAVYPTDGEDPETLLRNAGAAMHFAKEQGRDNYQFYSRGMNASALEKLAMEGQLRRALERNEFVLHYQPKVDPHTGHSCGVEALLRWKHPDLGMVPPGQFIPIAEQTGLIIPIGDWVLTQACRQAQEWISDGRPPISMAVNIASPHFRADLAGSVVRALQSSQLDPGLLELEMTESMLMQNIDATLRTLDALKAMGVKLSLDDFGTGYSSLSYLKRFPLDTLKIDRSFIQGLPDDGEDAAITQAILAMAHSLGLSVVAEGVETLAQLEFLQQHHCDLVQGFLFSKPRPPEEIPALLAPPAADAPAMTAGRGVLAQK